ncbi:putative integral membrane protein [Candida albicans]|uniref:Putative integral membrane protein n=1 Tax=Candida albicans TaxID=5476 RepID=A0A8H6BTU1_CANAX|nr:putative integral membrane protein [Candida albicans]
MAGTCITTIKLLGVGSLGLLSSSIIYQSLTKLPELIHQFNCQFNTNKDGGTHSSITLFEQQLYRLKNIIFGNRLINGALTAISTGLFALAFKYSVSNEKHPYLIYAALGAPLSFISLYYNIYSVEEKILSQQKSKSTSVAKTRTKSKHSESSKSYVHLSDESGISTPNSTTSHPSTPKLEPHQQEQEQPTPADDDVELEVEQEVENILIKKQVVQNLKKIESGYTIASYVSGISFVIASIGLIGDYYYF